MDIDFDIAFRGSAVAVDKVYKDKCLLKKTAYRMYWYVQKIVAMSLHLCEQTRVKMGIPNFWPVTKH